MTQTTIDKIKAEREGHEANIALKEAVNRLQKNKDFKRVIEQAFMETECARNARISGLIYSFTEVERADALAKAQAAGHLAEFLSAVINRGTAAENALRALNENEAILIAESNEVEEV